MSAELLKQILDEHPELSSLPQTLVEVLRVARDDNSSANELAKIIMRDPALTAKILRLVNSPYYGGREVTNVSQAVMTLGLRAVSALALSTSIYDMTGKWETAVNRHRFWRHSLQVGLASRDIATALKYPFPEETFVCGMLHDIGILVLEQSFPKKFARVWHQVESGESLCDIEDQVWGTNHARIGQFLLEQWGLPSLITEAVGMHHSGILTQSNEPEFLVPRIVALANQVSRLTIATSRPDLHGDIEVRESLRGSLDLAQEDLIQIDKDLLAKTSEEAAFLEVDLGSQEELLMEANRLIYEHYLALDQLLRENRRMQRELARAQVEKAALDALRTIAATFNHYINNAAATILGRAQLVEVKLKRGEIIDLSGETSRAMQIIVGGVNTVCSVIEELKNLTSFSTTVYHDDTFILDIEGRIKEKLETLEVDPDEMKAQIEEKPATS